MPRRVMAARVWAEANAGGSAGQTGAGSAGSTDAATAGGSRPLGAGYTDDSQCSSNICGKAASTDTAGSCCNGRPDVCNVCNVCTGGYLTPVQNGTSAGLCMQCESGKATNLADGTSCGTDMNGAGPPSCNGLMGSDYRCSAGACVQRANVDCSAYVCNKAGMRRCKPGRRHGSSGLRTVLLHRSLRSGVRLEGFDWCPDSTFASGWGVLNRTGSVLR
jgi:hypothetical protein